MNYIGELAGLVTSVSFSFGSTFFTLAGRRVGSIVVNRVRMLFAIGFVIITHWIVLGTPIPVDADPERWIWLGLSGLVGFVIGDFFLFQAFVWIGPRLSMLMMSLVPVISAFQAWIFLGETITLAQMIGILLTVGGVAWVVMGRNASNNDKEKNYMRGILYGLGGAVGQASGLVLAKNGLAGEFSPISANLIRLIIGTAVLWIITLIQKESKTTFKKIVNDSRGLLFVALGSFAGPFLGVSFSMLAIQNTEVGVASTLMALPPVFSLPIIIFIFKERFGFPAIAGTLLAIGGVALIFLF